MKGLTNQEDMHKYDDMIDLPHPVSKKHPQMPVSDRAAQFAPFAALTGHHEAVKETARLTDEQAELDENVREALDRKLKRIQRHLDERPAVTVTYFIPDSEKAGGSYVTAAGHVKKIDEGKKAIILADGTSISVDKITEIQCMQ